MKTINWFLLIAIVLGIVSSSSSQTSSLTLEECYSLAEKNYPLIKQQELITQSSAFTLDNINKRYLPQVSLNGQATYQSDVTQLPISLPGITMQTIAKDQYKLYGEINQPITDLFTIKQHKELATTSVKIEEQKLDIEIYALKERINQLYFGVLLIDAQLEKTLVLQKELKSSTQRLNTAITNGVSLESDAALLQIEHIKSNQRIIELTASRKAFMAMLSQFLNQQLDAQTQLATPIISEASYTINRPELLLFETQKNSFSIQDKLITAKNLPRVSFFFQGGYGRPALNFLSNQFDAYYITGLRLNWNFTGFYTAKKERSLLTINQNIIDIRRETFEFNTNMMVAQQNIEVDKIEQLITTDAEIIALHKTIIETANIQLENGEITTIEYLSTLNALDQARLNQSLHEVQLQMTKSTIQITTGN